MAFRRGGKGHILTVGSTSSTSSTSPIGTQAFAGMNISNSGGTAPPITFNGVISGTNTTAMIQALMVAYELPQADIQNQINQLNSNLNDYQQLSSDLSSLQTASDAISQNFLWNATTAASSNSSVATATTTSGAQPGSLSFNVNQLAQAQVIASTNSVSSTSSVVANSPILLAVGAGQYGVTSLAGSGLTTGSHSINVTSALTGASTTGTSQLAGSTTITAGTNDTITANVNGTAQTFTIAAGTYTQSQLAAAVQAATTSSGTPLLNAGVSSTGDLQLNTSLLGSSSSLQITGGTALSALGLAAQTGASTGTAGAVNLDGGTSVAVNNVQSGSTVAVAGPNGSSVTLGIGATGLSTGTLTANEIGIGGGSLSSVVSAINSATAGVSASAVQVGSGAYVLQISSNQTGTNGAITMSNSSFSSSLGTMATVTAAQDAQIQIGGSTGYTVDSSSNAVTNVLQGVSINLVSAQPPGSSPVTLTISPNGTAMAGAVQTMVNAANQALADINTYAGYNATTKTGGPLMGDSNLTNLTTQILGVVADSAVGNNGITPTSVGLDLTANGTITFNQSTFEAAYQANPTGVAQLFSQGGSLTPSSPTYAGSVGLVFASDGTMPGSYNVNVSQSATQATDTGNVISSGTITAAENITVALGTSNITYAATAGESLSSIATGLNSLLSSAGIGIGASVNTVSGGSQIVLKSATFGSQSSFSVTSSAVGAGQTGLATTANTASQFAGLDVAGTINGVTATGSGQTLSAPLSDPTLAGLALNVTASGISTATNLGNFSYSPGIAGGMAFQGNLASSPLGGSLTGTITSLNQQIQTLTQQYNGYTPMIQAEQQMLQTEFTNMETTMSGLNSQGSWLAQQIKNLP